MLNGPQALTIFTIAKDEQVPASAKTSSFATPQGYYCTETNKLHMFIKGNEYCFIDMEEHERVVTEALGKREHSADSGEEDGELAERLCGEVGMTSQQVVNAIQAGNASLAAQMQSCCCDIRNSITTSNYENQLQIINQTNALSSQLQSQTNILSAKIDAQTQLLNDRFCQLELREQARIITKQGNEISDLKGRLSTQEILAAIGTKTTSSAS